MEKRHTEKGKRFEFLVRQIDKGLNEGFYVEAFSITYALFEERTYRLLELLQIPFATNDKFYVCLSKLESAVSSGAIEVTSKRLTQSVFINYHQFLNNNLVADIQTWRKKRNDVIHDLAKETIDYESLSTYAREGRELFGIYTAAIMRIKEQCNH